MKSKEAVTILKEEKLYLSNNNANEVINAIEKELAKPQELYNKIKEKRDNARLIREEHTRKQDISDEEKSEIYAEICTYNDILLLMKSMFEVEENEN